MQAILDRIRALWNSGRNGKLAVGLLGAVLACGLCSIAGLIVGPQQQANAPTRVPAAPAAAAAPLSSGGIGVSRADWEATHGAGTKDTLGSRYGDTIVSYQPDTTGADAAGYIEKQWGDANAQALDAARAAGKALAPIDSTLVKTYEANGRTVDLYTSNWLKDRFLATIKIKDKDWPVWVNGEPGQFIVLYRITDGKVTSIVMALGNNP